MCRKAKIRFSAVFAAGGRLLQIPRGESKKCNLYFSLLDFPSKRKIFAVVVGNICSFLYRERERNSVVNPDPDPELFASYPDPARMKDQIN